MPDYTAGKARILLEPTARGFFTKARTAIRAEMGGRPLEADVLLKPVVTRFRQDADARLRAMRGIDYQVTLRPNIPNRALFRADAKTQAETHLKGLYATMQVRAEVGFGYADAQLKAWRTRQEANPLKIRVITEHVGGVGRPGGGNQIQRDRIVQLQPERTMAFGHDVPIIRPRVDDGDVKQGFERLKRDVERPGRQPKIKPTVDDRGLKDELSRVLREAFRPKRLPGPSIRGVELLAPAMLALSSEAAPALVAALGGVVGAIQEMSGAALAAPGALAVLGTSISTLALGVNGIKAAWKALSQEQDRSGSQATADADKFNRSQEQMGHALSDQKKAQEDLTKARRDARRTLEDLHAEERSSYLSVAEAALDLQKARNELAKPSEGPLDYNEKVIAELRARENLSSAIRRQNRTKEDTVEADKKGIESSDQVRNAQEALVRSNEQVADTLKQIQEGSAGAAGAADKVKAAMADLSPNAAALTQTLFDLRESALKPLSRAVSQNMFAGLSDSIKALVNADMPLLTAGFSRVGSAINRNLLQIGRSLNTDQNRGVLERIFGNTEEFHKRLNAAIDPAIRAVGTLAAAGSDAMPRLATEFSKVTSKFADFIDKADKEGRLDKWITRGIDGVESLGRSFGNVLRALSSIGQAFGGGLLTSIEHVTKRIADFFASGRGQNSLLEIVHLVRREFEDWRPILQDLPTIFGAAMTGIRGTMGTLLPILNVFTSLLRAFPGLASVAASSFIAWRAFTPILALVSTSLIGIQRGLNVIPGVARGAAPAIKKVADEAALMSTGFVGVGRNAAAAERAAGGSMSRLAGTIKGGATGAVNGLKGALGSAATFLSGPWGIAITVAIGFLTQLIQSNHDAAESADANRAAQEKLAGSLEDVTNAAGAASRAQISKELESYTPEKGLQGNVRAAVESLGIGRGDFLKAVLPGGQAQAQDYYQQFRKTAHDQILGSVSEAAKKFLREVGFSDENLVDAYLGDQTQVARLQEIQNRPDMKIALGTTGFGGGLASIKVSGQALSASLGAQYLSRTVPALQGAQEAARQAQVTAIGGKPTMSASGAAIFGPTARPFFDGTTARVEVDGNFMETNKDRADNLKARGSTLTYDAFRNVTTITVGADDVNNLINIPTPPSRSAGGPSPQVGMPGPTGGIISELHPEEWVLPKQARKRLGDDWLWEQTKNKAMDRRGSYQGGGPIPFPLTPPIPPPPPPPGVGAAAGPPAPSVAADVHGAPGAAPAPPPGPPPPAGPAPPIDVGRTPANATPDEKAVLNAPGPTVDAQGNVTSPQAGTPDIGKRMSDMFLAPWGFKTDAQGQPASAGGGAAGGGTDPGTYLGKWAANFGVALGGELISGVAGFFGINADNIYVQALQKTIGFYSGKLGGADQQVDAATQGIVGSQIAGYQSVVGADGTTFLIPTGGGGDAGAAGGMPAADLGDLGKLPPGKASEGGLQPNAVKTNRALSASFPQIGEIGGVRADPLKWHPMGLALDVMIPGGDTHGGRNPEGKALGDRIWAWMGAHASELGIDMNDSLWQTDQGGNHYTHIHLTVFGRGNPGGNDPQGTGAPAPAAAGGGAGAGTPAAPDAGGGGVPPLLVPGAGGATPSYPGHGSGLDKYGVPGLEGILHNYAGGGIGGGGAAAPQSALHPPPTKGLGGFTSDLENRRYKMGLDPRTGTDPLGPGGTLPQVFTSNGKRYVVVQSGRGTQMSSARAPNANYGGGSAQVHDAVYQSFLKAGFTDSDWPALVQILNHESSWNPTISNPTSGAYGLFQFLGHQNDKYARGYSSDPSQQAEAGMQYIKDRYGTPSSAWSFWQGHNWYDDGGLLKRGVTFMHHDQPEPDVVVPHVAAAAAVKALSAIGPPSPPGMGPDAQRKAEPPPDDLNIPKALPPAGPQARTPPPQPPPAAPPAPSPTATVPAAPPAAAAPPGEHPPIEAPSHEHPGLQKGVTSGAAAAGNIASAVAGAFGGGAAGGLIGGLFAQGGKIANDIINVGATFASGFLHFGGTTENPYGVQAHRKDQPPALATDNRRVHMGDNYFASMDEWRRQNQLQDSQDMQAGMARMKQ